MTPCLWLVNRPKPYLMAFIYALVVSGVYSIETSLFHVGLVLVFGAARLRDAVLQGAVPADGARRRPRIHGGIELSPRAGRFPAATT